MGVGALKRVCRGGLAGPEHPWRRVTRFSTSVVGHRWASRCQADLRAEKMPWACREMMKSNISFIQIVLPAMALQVS